MKLKEILKNGDICEYVVNNKITFGFYMDGFIYSNLENNIISQLGGYEDFIIKVMRPCCLGNSFSLFKYADNYNWNYSDYGEFKLIYERII